MPTTDQKSELEAGERVAGPGVELVGGTGRPDLSSAAAVILSVRPSQPPTRCRPIRVSGSSDATITKNCSTSL